MAYIDSEYKLGDLVMYNNTPYRVKAVRRITTSIGYTIWDYEYDLKLIREPREGELSVIRGVNERAISRKGKVDDERKERPEYFPGYRYDPKFMENMMYPVKSSLKALGELNRKEVERIAAEPIRFNAEMLKAINDEVKIDPIKFKEEINAMFGVSKFEYKKIIFSGPCTIILWKDGTKTMAKTSSDEEVFDPEKGVAICFMKRMLGHTETNKILRKASEQYEEYIAENRPNASFDEFIDFCKDYFKSKTKSVNHIDQSTIDEVKKVEEEQDESK